MHFDEELIKEAMSLIVRDKLPGRVLLQKKLNLSQQDSRLLAKEVKYRFKGGVVDEQLSNKSETKSNNYTTGPSIMSAWDVGGTVMDIDKYCEHYGLPRGDIKSYKLVSHTGTPFYNIVFHEKTFDLEFLTEEFIDGIVQKYINPVQYEKPAKASWGLNVTRGIYSDQHIGMDPDSEGTALSHSEWTFKEQKESILAFANDLVDVGHKGSVLFVDNLGDFADGQNESTERGGHRLPQNMHNAEMFDNCVELHILLADTLAASGKFSKITLNNVTNDNHSGSIDYYIASTVKRVLELKYRGLISVINYRRFIDHYFIGDHCFILCHGKDKKNLKFGFKPKLDADGKDKINNYIREEKITSPYIEFSKGDSHQMLFDYCSSDLFDYCNYPSFAPSSEWAHTNYQKGRAGFVIQTFNSFQKRKFVAPNEF